MSMLLLLALIHRPVIVIVIAIAIAIAIAIEYDLGAID
jgi:hypothetical protein